ncbi:hypothetical protein [Caulobacter sp. UNC279MFTsu5.1]|uniref:hypothetical protein n=1 Tax=Caulobacter sp. UNC279MFTsu5.1 TaxID=1502775 RepID=UPI0008E7EF6F|nr:hypothetical protein [Caulobacter sp. UNC279MFTsu5.1]SFK26305.1 hypothetical protein SAMN02799626_03834 [Caulobacter sp. UNC279MFTsu5.1]
MQFKVTEAAFEGFRLIRREPRTIVIWAVFSLVASVALLAAMIASGFSRFMGVSAAQGTMTPEALTGFLVGEVIAIGGAILIASVMGAAVYRAILRPAEAPLTRLRLGGDELRLVLLSLIMGVVFTGLLIALVIPVALVSTVIGFAGLAGPGGGESGVGAMAGVVLLVLFSYLLVFAGLVFFAVRLSLAGVMTFAERRLRVFESWRLTKGRFWRLLGCYSLTVALMLPIYMVMMTVYFAVAFAFSGGDVGRAMGEIAQPDMTSLAAYFSPARIVYLVLAGAVGGVLNAVMYAPAAAVYRAIADTRPENQAEVFS